MLSAIDLVRVESREVVRDVTVACGDSGHADAVVRAVRDLEGVRVDSVSDRTFLMDKGGKIEVTSKLPLKTRRRRFDGLHPRGRAGFDGHP
jgi:malate dehydrogenase (oxaloacetate-decarboxylating)